MALLPLNYYQEKTQKTDINPWLFWKSIMWLGAFTRLVWLTVSTWSHQSLSEKYYMSIQERRCGQ